jgi:CHAT domain-containing protein
MNRRGKGRNGYFYLQERAREDYYLGNIERAVVLSKAAASNAPNSSARAGCYFDNAVFLAESGDYISAKRAFSAAKADMFQTRKRQRKYHQSWATKWELKFSYLSALSEASVQFAKGNMKQAEALYYKALDNLLEIRQTTSLTYATQGHLLAQVKNGIARSLLWQGRLMEAEIWAREALSDHWGFMLPRVFTTLSRIFYEQGRFEEGRILAQTMVNMFTSNRLETNACEPLDSLARAFSREALARAYLAMGQYSKALEQYELIKKEMATDPETYNRLFNGHLDFGVALLLTGRIEAARDQLARTLEKATNQFGSDHYSAREAGALLALAHSSKGEEIAARKALGQFFDWYFTHRKDGTSGGISHFTHQQRLELIVEGYVELLARSADTPSVIKAFEVASTTQNHSVGKALSASSARSAAGDPDLVALIRQRQDLQMNLAANQDRMVNLVQAKSSVSRKKVLDELKTKADQLKSAFAALDKEIESKFPDFEKMVSTAKVSLEQIRQVLTGDEAFLSVFSGQNGTYVWAFKKTGKVAFTSVPLSTAELGQQIATLREALTPGAISTVNDIPVFSTGLAHELYGRIMAPVEAGWKTAKLLMVTANAPLDRLPLSLLVIQPVKAVRHNRGKWFSEYRNIPWLARSHAVTQLPSAASIVKLRERVPTTEKMLAFAGFGDPFFESNLDNQTSTGDTAAIVKRGLHLRAIPVARGVKVTSVPFSKLPRLPETADEVKEIAIAVGADPEKDVYCGIEASESRVKKMDLSNRRILVFATHGLMPGDIDGLHQPALALSHPSLQEVQDNDGLLTMGEIMWLRLNADWVVMSACNTAAARGNGKEALSGLGQAFFYAGAKSLLVTSWPVETNSAKALTTGLFRHLAEHPHTPRSEALRLSCLALIDGAGQGEYTYAHPMFWAPFVLAGDGGN